MARRRSSFRPRVHRQRRLFRRLRIRYEGYQLALVTAVEMEEMSWVQIIDSNCEATWPFRSEYRFANDDWFC